ncbi:MAG: 1-deoxy-D-xylulose-5-phosphate reductoisomerase, partial [Acidobacteria bacterium]|nr:1-deoxy-D-xylulose-5-phosphate reductoisomerase [Acidobacteriota bacterium]
SIGASALSAVALYSDRFEIVTMAAGSNLEAFLPICASVRPKVVAVKSKEHAEILRRELPGIAVGFGPQGLIDVATHSDVDVVLGGLVGSVGLVPAYEAVKAGKTLALANKETLVVAGEPLMRKARETGAAVLPVDSEHCALHQALRAGAAHEVQRLVLTASGGPFRTRPIETFAEITIQDALAHPTWKMGPKITIDSATMMNKGLEVIEARWLFDVVPGKIDVLVHPQSIVHSLVEYVDGSFLAQMSPNDMRFPILYALSYPDRLPTPMPRLDLGALARLDFAPLDPVRYPALPLTYAALREGGTAPAALNAANEVAVQAFLDGRLSYNAIVELVGQILVRHTVRPVDTVEDALEADRWARAEAAALVPTFEKRLRVAVPTASLSRNP